MAQGIKAEYQIQDFTPLSHPIYCIRNFFVKLLTTLNLSHKSQACQGGKGKGIAKGGTP